MVFDASWCIRWKLTELMKLNKFYVVISSQLLANLLTKKLHLYLLICKKKDDYQLFGNFHNVCSSRCRKFMSHQKHVTPVEKFVEYNKHAKSQNH